MWATGSDLACSGEWERLAILIQVSQFLLPDESSVQPSAVFAAGWGFPRIERLRKEVLNPSLSPAE
jgi:hypothetical protein